MGSSSTAPAGDRFDLLDTPGDGCFSARIVHVSATHTAPHSLAVGGRDPQCDDHGSDQQGPRDYSLCSSHTLPNSNTRRFAGAKFAPGRSQSGF